MRIGVLHPGEMGISVAQALRDAGHSACWVSAGRSQQTLDRAADLQAYADLKSLLGEVAAVVSVCPPHAAMAQACAVKNAGFDGVYVDANAVAPATAAGISELMGSEYVDGGIVGPPAHSAGTTRLYLSGPRAAEVAGWFDHSAMAAVAMDGDVTAASTLKMAYAAYTKGSSALLLAVNALAMKAGIRETLVEEWTLSQPGLVKRSETTALGTSRKAWRFVGEMQEIAQTFADLDLPNGFHQGAAEIYGRMAGLKDLPPAELLQVLSQIIDKDPSEELK
jgi:3-hydroxyisobutyrate dehydrogenase-like beta-hydroxyacid dehydrogenase